MRHKTAFAIVAGMLLLALQAPAQDTDLAGKFVTNLEDAQGKLLQLAEAFPADKYDWRPAEGIRSVSEVFMHVTGTYYMLGGGFGVEVPSDARALEQNVTTKSEVIARMKASFAAINQGIGSADLSTQAQLFGQQVTLTDTALLLVSHTHEHLGQMIAYARSNGVVPPWSE